MYFERVLLTVNLTLETSGMDQMLMGAIECENILLFLQVLGAKLACPNDLGLSEREVVEVSQPLRHGSFVEPLEVGKRLEARVLSFGIAGVGTLLAEVGLGLDFFAQRVELRRVDRTLELRLHLLSRRNHFKQAHHRVDQVLQKQERENQEPNKSHKKQEYYNVENEGSLVLAAVSLKQHFHAKYLPVKYEPVEQKVPSQTYNWLSCLPLLHYDPFHGLENQL